MACLLPPGICGLAFLLSLRAAAGSEAASSSCPAGPGSCKGSSSQPGTDHILVQTRRDLRTGRVQADAVADVSTVAADEEVLDARARHHGRRTDGNLTSNCAGRLGHGSSRASACLVLRSNKVLMVKVPYGSHPGWDFPGGRAHSGEAPCQTAEREVCEETGYGVRAVSQLSGHVFRCEIVASGVCTKPVDEGFLEKRWFSGREVSQIGMRNNGHTWGDMRGIIGGHLSSATRRRRRRGP